MALPHGLTPRGGYFRPEPRWIDAKSASLHVWLVSVWLAALRRGRALAHRRIETRAVARRTTDVAGGVLLVMVGVVAMAAVIAVVVAGMLAMAVGFLSMAALM